MLGHRFGKRGATLDFLDHAAEGVLQRSGLGLAFENREAAENGESRVLERGELPGEGAQLLGTDLAEREPALLLFLGGRLLGVLVLLLFSS